jgi:hypothetical protein
MSCVFFEVRNEYLNIIKTSFDFKGLITPSHRLRVFENRMLRRISGSKREEVTGGWRQLNNKELQNLYSSANIRIIKSRRIR